jgi:hypothetical protein
VIAAVALEPEDGAEPRLKQALRALDLESPNSLVCGANSLVYGALPLELLAELELARNSGRAADATL